MKNDDEPYIHGEYENGALIEVCLDSMKVTDSLVGEKKDVIIKLLGEPQYYFVYLGNKKHDQSNNIITTNFSSPKG